MQQTITPTETSVGQVPMNRLRTIFDGMFDGVWLIGSEGATTYVNDAMASLLGLSADEMHGHPITEYLSAEYRVIADAMIARQRQSPGERVDMRFLRADGTDLWTLVAASPIETADGTFVGSMLNVSDVTGKRAAQQQAIQNQKLEAIGAFASAITHDFNNLLTSIRGYAELAASDLSELDGAETASVRADLVQVIDSADRATAITARLLAFTRGQALQPVVIDPGLVILDMAPMLRPLLSDGIEVNVDVAQGQSRIEIDPAALDQIIVNLAVNAGDAMPSGGALQISMDELEGRPQESLGLEARPPSIRIRVRDSGSGMEASTLEHLFDPFFTTKQVGKGTGLGLSTVYGLIAQSGGTITVESELGVGTNFTIVFPKVDVQVPTVESPREKAASLGFGVVLIAEDEAGVRELARRVLERAGHSVITARDGPRALSVAKEVPGQIDVLLTDVAMPGMSGQDLAAQMLKVRPDMRVLFMSGYAEDAIPVLDRPSTAFLRKPFSADSLTQAVARELARARELREESQVVAGLPAP